MAGWDPWQDAGRRPRLEIWFGSVPQGATWHEDEDGDVITIDAGASRRQRRALLAHELVHAERRVGFPAATTATMQREEAMVRRETALRLVPLRELASLVRRRGEVEPITAALVADEFDVPDDVAGEALVALRQRGAELGLGPETR
jgi:hypothetical protein